MRLLLVFSPLVAAAASTGDALQSIGVTPGTGRGLTLSVPMQIALGLTLLTLLPAVIMCITPFLRIAVVLHFLRQALGTQTAPSNQVLVGLSLFLSLVIVQPMFADIYSHAWQPLEKGQITAEQAFDQGSVPLRKFLVRFARERDIRLFVEISKSPRRATAPTSACASSFRPTFFPSSRPASRSAPCCSCRFS